VIASARLFVPPVQRWEKRHVTACLLGPTSHSISLQLIPAPPPPRPHDDAAIAEIWQDVALDDITAYNAFSAMDTT
jgi:hypothetical protein